MWGVVKTTWLIYLFSYDGIWRLHDQPVVPVPLFSKTLPWICVDVVCLAQNVPPTCVQKSVKRTSTGTFPLSWGPSMDTSRTRARGHAYYHGWLSPYNFLWWILHKPWFYAPVLKDISRKNFVRKILCFVTNILLDKVVIGDQQQVPLMTQK